MEYQETKNGDQPAQDIEQNLEPSIELKGVIPSVYKKGSSDSTEDGSEDNPYLPSSIQKKMEVSFGESFSNVNIYKASLEANKKGTKAFTKGNTIHFKEGYFNPYTKMGQKLLAHELTHIVQQRRNYLTGKSGAYKEMEKEAEHIADAVVDNQRVNVQGAYTFGAVQMDNDFVDPPKKNKDVIWFNIDLDADLGRKEVQIQLIKNHKLDDRGYGSTDFYLALIDRQENSEADVIEPTPDFESENIVKLEGFKYHYFNPNFIKHNQRIGTNPYVITLQDNGRIEIKPTFGEDKLMYDIDTSWSSRQKVGLNKNEQKRLFEKPSLAYMQDYDFFELDDAIENGKTELRDYHFKVPTTIGDLFYIVFHSTKSNDESYIINSFTVYFQRSENELVKHLNYQIPVIGKQTIKSYDDFKFISRENRLELTINTDADLKPSFNFYYSTTTLNRAPETKYAVSLSVESTTSMIAGNNELVSHPSNTFENSTGQMRPVTKGSVVKNPGESNEQVFSLLDGLERTKKNSMQDELLEIDEIEFSLILGAGLESESIPKHLILNYYRFKENLKGILNETKKLKIEQLKKLLFQLYNSLLDLNVTYNPSELNYKKGLKAAFENARNSKEANNLYTPKQDELTLPQHIKEQNPTFGTVFNESEENRIIHLYGLLYSINKQNVIERIEQINEQIHDIFTDKIGLNSRLVDSSLEIFAQNLNQKRKFRKGIKNYLMATGLDADALRPISAVFVPEVEQDQPGIQYPLTLYYHLDKDNPSKTTLVYFRDTGEQVVYTKVKADTKAADGGKLKINPSLFDFLDDEHILGKGNLYYKGTDGQNFKYVFKNESTWGETAQVGAMIALAIGILFVTGGTGIASLSVLIPYGELVLTASIGLGVIGATLEGVHYHNNGKRHWGLSFLNVVLQAVPLVTRLTKSLQAGNAIKTVAEIEKIAKNQRFLTGVELGTDFASGALDFGLMVKENRLNEFDVSIVTLQMLSSLLGVYNFNKAGKQPFGNKSIADPHQGVFGGIDKLKQNQLENLYSKTNQSIVIKSRDPKEHLGPFEIKLKGYVQDEDTIHDIIQATKWFDQTQLADITEKMKKLLSKSEIEYEFLLLMMKKHDSALIMRNIVDIKGDINIVALANDFNIKPSVYQNFKNRRESHYHGKGDKPATDISEGTAAIPEVEKNPNLDETVANQTKVNDELTATNINDEIFKAQKNQRQISHKEKIKIEQNSKLKRDQKKAEKIKTQKEREKRQQQINTITKQRKNLERLENKIPNLDTLEEDIDVALYFFNFELGLLAHNDKRYKKTARKYKTAKQKLKAINNSITTLRQAKRKKKYIEPIFLLEKEKILLKEELSSLRNKLENDQDFLKINYGLYSDSGKDIARLFKQGNEKYTLLEQKMKKFRNFKAQANLQNLDQKKPGTLKRMSISLDRAENELKEIIVLKEELNAIVKQFNSYTEKVKANTQKSIFGKANQAVAIDKSLTELDDEITIIEENIIEINTNLKESLEANTKDKQQKIKVVTKKINKKYTAKLKQNLIDISHNLGKQKGIKNLELEKEYESFQKGIDDLIASEGDFYNIKNRYRTLRKKFTSDVTQKLNKQKNEWNARQKLNSKRTSPNSLDLLSYSSKRFDPSQTIGLTLNEPKTKKEVFLELFSEYRKSPRFGKTRMGLSLFRKVAHHYSKNSDKKLTYLQALEKVEILINAEKIKVKNELVKLDSSNSEKQRLINQKEQELEEIENAITKNNQSIDYYKAKLKSAKPENKEEIQRKIDAFQVREADLNDKHSVKLSELLPLQNEFDTSQIYYDKIKEEFDIFEAIHKDVKYMMGDKFLDIENMSY